MEQQPDQDRRQAPVVLVVGDEPGTVEVYARLLDRDGLRVDRAGGAASGSAQARTTLPRCVIVDLPHAGVGSALQLLGWLRSDDDPRVATTRVVVIDAEANREVLLASGADAHLSRPVHARDLLGAVAALVGAR